MGEGITAVENAPFIYIPQPGLGLVVPGRAKSCAGQEQGGQVEVEQRVRQRPRQLGVTGKTQRPELSERSQFGRDRSRQPIRRQAQRDEVCESSQFGRNGARQAVGG